MKRTNVFQDIYAVVKVALHFGWQHHAALTMLPGVYNRQLPQEALRVAGVETTLSIQSVGSLYRVTRTEYTGDEVTDEQNWLAIYSRGGHLLEIGGWRCCFMETVSQSIYLETLTDEGNMTVELFIKTL